jgi:predicted dehydrogenase
VVCSTRVDLHHSTIRPSIEAGKDVYVEWPLGANVEQARDLADLARQKGVRSIIGLQCRESPITTVKPLLASGKIGKLLSSSIVASGGSRLRDSLRSGGTTECA